jgi:hypothetical protein
MNGRFVRLTIFATILGSATSVRAQVCTRIDTATDALTDAERGAAIVMLNRQFALEGERVVPDCPSPYLLTHAKLGNTIVVTLSGPRGQRDGVALGLDDLPALYNQMVKSLLTGRPMVGLAVVDRTNVTEAQATARRVHADSFTYARLGYGAVFADQAYATPSFGFGHRAELDKVAIDVAFLDTALGSSDYWTGSGSASTFALLKLSGLYLLNREANSTPYFGGGLSWGWTHVDAARSTSAFRADTGPNAVYTYTTGGHGNGLQTHLTGGYEFGRATTIRMFVQADAALPLYSITTSTRSSTGGVSSTTRYTPSLVVSLGLGWQRNRK